MSSAAHAFTLGSPDGKVDRDTLDGTAEAVRVAAEVGLQGIADDLLQGTQTVYDLDLAVGKIRAATEAARALPCDFVLMARADGIMVDTYDINEAIGLLKAFSAAGQIVFTRL